MTGNISKESVRAYLDAAINGWATRYRESTEDIQRRQAWTYIDAFQAARESLLGEKLPIVE